MPKPQRYSKKERGNPKKIGAVSIYKKYKEINPNTKKQYTQREGAEHFKISEGSVYMYIAQYKKKQSGKVGPKRLSQIDNLNTIETSLSIVPTKIIQELNTLNDKSSTDEWFSTPEAFKLSTWDAIVKGIQIQLDEAKSYRDEVKSIEEVQSKLLKAFPNMKAQSQYINYPTP